MQDFSAVIVTHNSEAVTGACLDALSGCGEVIVVDNASADRTVAEVARRPRAGPVVNSSNRGFAGGVNQGVWLAHGLALVRS